MNVGTTVVIFHIRFVFLKLDGIAKLEWPHFAPYFWRCIGVVQGILQHSGYSSEMHSTGPVEQKLCNELLNYTPV